MDKADVMLGLAEVSVAMVGFTGIVAALGLRGDWAPGRRFQLWLMIELSLACLFFCLAPVVLEGFELGETPVWRGAHGLMIVFLVGHILVVAPRVGRYVRAGEFSPWLPRTVGPLLGVTLLTLVVSVLEFMPVPMFGAYLLALLFLLAIAAANFVFLLASFAGDGGDAP